MSDTKKRISAPEFVAMCDACDNFDEVAENLGVKVNTIQQRYYKLRKQYPGIFRKKLTAQRPEPVDLLTEVAKLRNISVDELRQEMLERS